MRHLLILTLCFLSLTASSQTKEKKPKPEKISTIQKDATTAIKNISGQEAVQQRAFKAIAREDVSTKQRADLYYTVSLLDESINEVQNRKAYLKQPYDTTKLFTTLLTMYQHLAQCDSVDHVPTAKGFAQPRYIRRTAALRSKHRRNMLNGGKFFLSKQNYATALQFFDAYYDYRPSSESPEMDKVIVWATMCAYTTKNYPSVLKYIDLAISQTTNELKPVYDEIKAETYRQMNNDSVWFELLKEGVERYPYHNYFFAHLVDVYTEKKLTAEGLELCDHQLELYPDTALYWYAKSNFSLMQEDYDHAIEYCDSAIARKETYEEAHYNRAVAYVTKAIIAQETSSMDLHDEQSHKDRSLVQSLYLAAKPSMELVRKMEPDKPECWASALYRIYLNLNMGKEFDEIDKLMKRKK